MEGSDAEEKDYIDTFEDLEKGFYSGAQKLGYAIGDLATAGIDLTVGRLFDHIVKVKRTNVAILMVEQNAKQALKISDRGYVLVTGENRYSGTGKELLNDSRVRSSFLGG